MASTVMALGCGCSPKRAVSLSCSSLSPSPVCSLSVSGSVMNCKKPASSLILHSALVSKSWSSNFFDGGVSRLVLAAAVAFACRTDGKRCGGALSAEMNIFERLARIVSSYANAVMSAAEDPEKLLDQTVLEMSEDLTKMRQTSAQVLASQKQLENKYKLSLQTSEDWYRRAKLALEKGDEALAREALKRRKDYEEGAKALKSQLDQQKSVVETLMGNTRLLETKIQEAKSKKDTLKARAQSAKTAQKVNEMLGNIKTSSALAAFDRMEEKVIALEAEAEALNQLTTDDLAGRFAVLESESVDDDLASLKREMLGPPKRAGELPEGRPTVSSSSINKASPFKDFEIEKELNELRRKAKEL